MSFQGKLKLDDQEFNLLNLKISFHQPMDANGKPNANPNGGLIYLSIESPNAANPFFAWMLAAELTKDGSIEFADRTRGVPSRIIEFEKAYCVGYDEDFTANGSSPMSIKLVISAKTLKSGSEAHEKTWES